MRKLLLLDFSGVRYGVWEDTVPSIRSARGLQRLPLSPADIAGIALLDERSAVIADLGVCLGRPPLARPRDGALLVLNVADQVAGFCVANDFATVDCPEAAILPLPAAVATPVADSCVLLDAVLIPLINLDQLQQRLQQGQLDLPALPPLPSSDSCDLAVVPAVQVVAFGGARFCVDAAQSSCAPLGTGGIVPLPLHSTRLAGVTWHDGEVLPVLLPGALPGFGHGVGQGGLLVTGPPQGRYALAVDAVLGVLSGPELALLPLPQLASRPWLPAAAVMPGGSTLFIDCCAFAAADAAAGERPPSVHFTPASRFLQQFLHSDSAVVEFSLLGSRHAIPQEEVRDDHPLLPILPVPGTAEIVLGVAPLHGELLPVLDLAALFGRRTSLGPQSHMLHLVNGDFQALLVTEEVTERRPLPLEVQRRVPIALPYQVLYGCYLAADMVRLILNVSSLAVHFKKMAVRDLVASLAPELLVAPAVEITSALSELASDGEDQDAAVAQATAETEVVPPAPPSVGASPPPAAEIAPITASAAEMGPSVADAEITRLAVAAAAQVTEETAAKERQRQAEEEAIKGRQRQEEAAARLQSEAEAREQERAIAAELARADAEKLRREADVRARAEAEAEAEARAQAAALAAAQEEEAKATRERQRQEVERAARERQLKEEAARVQAEATAREQERAVAVERARAEAEQLRREAEFRTRTEAEAQAQVATQQVAEVPEVLEAAKVAWYEQKTAAPRAEDADILAAFESTLIPEESTVAEPSPPPDSPPYKRPPPRGYGKQIGIAALVVLLLGLGIAFINLPQSPEQPLPEPAPLRSEASVKPAPLPPAPPMATITPTPPSPSSQSPAPAPAPAPPRALPAAPEAPLYLAVPVSKDVPESFVYTVVEGDNLWNIAKRFTGDPFNYPRVARDNSIATPDLIFPGQRIQLQPQTGAAAAGQ